MEETLFRKVVYMDFLQINWLNVVIPKSSQRQKVVILVMFPRPGVPEGKTPKQLLASRCSLPGRVYLREKDNRLTLIQQTCVGHVRCARRCGSWCFFSPTTF